MKINKIKILNIRNHEHSDIELSPHINVFFGLNGAGKTSVLESVSIAAFSRSFQANEEASIVRSGEANSFIRIDGTSSLGVPYFVTIANEFKPRNKIIKNSEGDNLIPKDIIGRLPIVILSPDLKCITSGSPADRRKFVNQILSQTSTLYSGNILKMRRCLKQRNKLLAQAKGDSYINKEQLDVLTEMFIELNAELLIKRAEFIEEYIPYFIESYKVISLGREDVQISYAPDSIKLEDKLSKDEIIEMYHEKADKLYDQELRRGTTLFGCQKDEVQFLINDKLVKETASQGQHKTFLIALKFAEFKFIKEAINETPVVLLDDIFAELDSDRSKKVIDFINMNQAQSLITITNPARLESFDKNELNSYYSVEDGKVSPINGAEINYKIEE